MRVALIAPPGLLGLVPDTQYNLVLGQELGSPGYLQHYKNHKGYVIMDNGAAELALMNDKAIVKAAMTLEPNEIVMPDVMGQANETIERVKTFDRMAKVYPEWSFMAVVQGQSFEEVTRCIRTYMSIDYVDTIALPRLLLAQSKWERLKILEWMDAKGLTDKQVHCLGSGPWMEEVKFLKDYPLVRGIDTSAPVAQGLKRLDLSYPYTGRPEGFWQADNLLTSAASFVYDNCMEYLSWTV